MRVRKSRNRPTNPSHRRRFSVGIATFAVLAGLTGQVTAAGDEATNSDAELAQTTPATFLGSVAMTDLAAEAPGAAAGAVSSIPYMPLPASLPVSNQSVEGSNVAARSPQPLGPSPAPSVDFKGNSYNGWIPPDTQGAVGPDHLMAVVNGTVEVQTRAGAIVSSVDLDDFWTGATINANSFDPRVQYNPHVDRWLLIAVSDARSASSSLLLAVTETNNPEGTWSRWQVDADATDVTWADYPNVGFNDSWAVVTANMFVTGGSFDRPKIWAVPTSDLYDGNSTISLLAWNALDFATFGSTLAPAATYDSGVTTMYLLENWNGNSGGMGYAKLFEITGSPTAPQIDSGRFISVPSTWASGQGNFAPQLGSSANIDNGDARMLSLVYRSSLLYAAQTVFLPAAAPTHSAVQVWAGIDPGTLNLTLCRIDDPAANLFRAYPSLAVNAAGDMLVGYSRFSASTYASAAYSFRGASSAACAFGDEVILKTGEAPYERLDGSSRNRWGDYSSTVVDVNDVDLWTIQEYAASPANTWGTWWGKVQPSSTGFLRVTTNPAVPAQVLIDGIPRDTWGLNWMKLDPGTYEVSFTDIQGFTTPDPETVTITAGDTTVFQGDYIERGWLQVSTGPPVPGTIYVDGIPRNDWGIWTDLEPGSYEVCFGDVPGYTTPACENTTLTPGALTTITGAYT